MGGTGKLLRPAPYDGLATFRTHTQRTPPSSEPGVDYYMPRFTKLRAAASGVVAEVYDGIGPAHGRFVKINLDNGQAIRYLHLERRLCNVGQRLAYGEVFAESGATGYGEADWSWNVAETGGAHVHVTLFPTHAYNNFRGLQDFHAYSENGNDMGTIDNTEENYRTIAGFLQRAFRFDVRPRGLGATWELGPTVFESLGAADDDAAVKALETVVKAARPAVSLSDADRKAIVDGVAATIRVPVAPSIDYAALAKAVNDDAAKRLAD